MLVDESLYIKYKLPTICLIKLIILITIQLYVQLTAIKYLKCEIHFER